MTLTIGRKPITDWVNLSSPGAEPGEDSVDFKMRRAHGGDEALAESNARAQIARIIEGQVQAAQYGLDQLTDTAWAEAVKDGEVDMLMGLGYQIYAVELAMLIGTDMRGVVDESGQPAEWTRRNVALVLQERRPQATPLAGLSRLGTTFADAFLTMAIAERRAAREEGKP